ncbi:hypothetical protein F7734_48035 [Scytonema sp. UIC 10036]|uniref:hypothetical protein n=1 Tax=Scytonema sp. UIC 10036 TaxID=2304196 RepID=UPI0012DA2D44|nr:hypothetical protein [Scytonema sp. UIC 10036]MUG99623.1 hypothetical protein [Scytonema sp. UIC 10036]
MSRIAIETMTSQTTEQAESVIITELNDEECVTIMGGRSNAYGGSNNDVDGANNVNVTVNVLPILSQNNLAASLGGLLSGLGSSLISGLGLTQA